jgi:hypothetical protein
MEALADWLAHNRTAIGRVSPQIRSDSTENREMVFTLSCVSLLYYSNFVLGTYKIVCGTRTTHAASLLVNTVRCELRPTADSSPGKAATNQITRQDLDRQSMNSSGNSQNRDAGVWGDMYELAKNQALGVSNYRIPSKNCTNAKQGGGSIFSVIFRDRQMHSFDLRPQLPRSRLSAVRE